jgi:hypothetical protein
VRHTLASQASAGRRKGQALTFCRVSGEEKLQEPTGGAGGQDTIVGTQERNMSVHEPHHLVLLAVVGNEGNGLGLHGRVGKGWRPTRAVGNDVQVATTPAWWIPGPVGLPAERRVGCFGRPLGNAQRSRAKVDVAADADALEGTVLRHVRSDICWIEKAYHGGAFTTGC